MLRKSPFIIILACLSVFATGSAARTPTDSERLPQPLPPPDLVEHDEGMEPEITIIQNEDSTIEEYRANGRVYMVKVTPFIGKPYYFIDRDGDGLMESRMSDLYNQTHVPQWVIFSW